MMLMFGVDHLLGGPCNLNMKGVVCCWDPDPSVGSVAQAQEVSLL